MHFICLFYSLLCLKSGDGSADMQIVIALCFKWKTNYFNYYFTGIKSRKSKWNHFQCAILLFYLEVDIKDGKREQGGKGPLHWVCFCGEDKIIRVAFILKRTIKAGPRLVSTEWFLSLQSPPDECLAPNLLAQGWARTLYNKNCCSWHKSHWSGFRTRVYWTINLKSYIDLRVQICIYYKTEISLYLPVMKWPAQTSFSGKPHLSCFI